MRRKGISPIIASVLLIAVSLSVAGIFTGWAPNIAQTFTDSTDETAEQRISCDQASIEMYSASPNSDLDVAVRNNGDIDFEGDNEVNVVAFDEDDIPIGDETIAVDTGSIEDDSISIDEGSADDVEYVTAFSEECGDVTSTYELG